jgi:hypothetical protein
MNNNPEFVKSFKKKQNTPNPSYLLNKSKEIEEIIKPSILNS